MPASSRVTITLPTEILSEIDRGDKNRSRFILEAVQREIVRRKKEALQRSLTQPHPDSQALESADLQAWFQAGEGDASELLDFNEGVEVHWIPGTGWMQGHP